MKYRDDSINTHMELIEYFLTAISEKNATKLEVMKFMKDDPTMSFDEAVREGMKQSANQVMIAVKALAMSFDRVLAVVEQMSDEMTKDGMPNGERYKKRAEMLTNFQRILDELDPEMARHFAHL